jgi:hypothetical protein
MTSDGLLAGAVDLHRHGYPELTPSQRPPLTDAEDIERCRDAGLRAVVLKSHMWPTVGRAYHLRRAVPGIQIFPSITLNPISGGFSALAVEAAAAQGARVLYMPTWGARNDIERDGFSKLLGKMFNHARLDPADALTVLDDGGALRGDVRDALGVAAESKMVVFSGHLSVAESRALADSGLAEDRFVFSHPDSHSIGATRGDIRTLAQLGATIEICALGIHPRINRISPQALAEVVVDVGPERCALTSDYFFEWAPPSAQSIEELARALISCGIAEDDVRTMAAANPARLLGLDDGGGWADGVRKEH